MRKLLSAVALICAILLTACSSSQPHPMPVDVPPPVEQKNTGLKLFYTSYLAYPSSILDSAVAEYNRQYPNQPVEVEKYFTEDLVAYQEEYLRIITQLMAGDGPDIFVLDTLTMGVEKMARGGVFADMEPYFQADSYDWSDFNQAVMDAGVWEEKRLVIPLSYQLPLLYTSAEAVEETGFSVENCSDFPGFLQEVEKLQENHPTAWQREFIASLPYYGGIPYVDYSQGTVDLTFPELRRCAEIYKGLEEQNLYFDSQSNEYCWAAGVRDGEILCGFSLYALKALIQGAGAIKTFDEPVVLPVRDMDGGIRAQITCSVAARNNSENLQNAYNFIKVLLSEELGEATIAIRGQEFSVQNSLNDRYYQFNVIDGHTVRIVPGSYGTFGFDETIPPTPEEYEELMEYTQEVTGAYFPNAVRDGFLRLMRSNSSYFEGTDSYDKAIKEVQKQLEIYLSE